MPHLDDEILENRTILLKNIDENAPKSLKNDVILAFIGPENVFLCKYRLVTHSKNRVYCFLDDEARCSCVFRNF